MSGQTLYHTVNMDYPIAERILTHNKALTSRTTPLFVFKYAPPGSGKSTCDDIIYKNFNLNSDDFVHLDVDELLESSMEVRTGTTAARAKYGAIKKSIDFSDETLKALLEEVNGIRSRETYAKVQNKTIDLTWSLADKIKAMLQISIDKNYHIMFDATGAAGAHNYYKRILNSIPAIYKIIFVYPILSQTSQKIRTFSRANKNFAESREDQRMYGRLRLDETRVLSTPQAKDFFLKTVIPMMYAGLIHEIIMVNNEDKAEFQSTVPLETTARDPSRRVSLRIDDTFPVGVDASGTITRTSQATDSFASDDDRLNAKIESAATKFNSINAAEVSAKFQGAAAASANVYKPPSPGSGSTTVYPSPAAYSSTASSPAASTGLRTTDPSPAAYSSTFPSPAVSSTGSRKSFRRARRNNKKTRRAH
jgi:hypothetical protein